MQYEIRYKIKPYVFGGRECGQDDPFPILVIRYRKAGVRKWTKMGNAEIDLYAFRRFRHTSYYDGFDAGTDIISLSQKSDYERLELFVKILADRYDGSIKKFVESIVIAELVLKNAEDDDRKEAKEFTMSMVTHGWETTNIDL